MNHFLYIGVGEKNCFFTLRECSTENRHDGDGGIYSVEIHHHVQNLSTDADEAFAKALDVSARTGIELISTRDRLADEMNEIRRASAEQVAERERFLKACGVES